MRQIVILGNYSQIQSEDDPELLIRLDQLLSFRVPGAQYSRAFKGFVDKSGKFQRWDGVRKILTGDLKFPTGLVPRIQQFYSEQNIQYTVQDQRPAKSSVKPDLDNILLKLKAIGKEPYDYQLAVLDQVRLHDRGIIKSATGSGKSLISLLITCDLNRSTVIYVIGKDLLYQFYNLYSELLGTENVGMVGDGHCNIRNVTIASIWTIGQALGLKKNEILVDSEQDDETLNLDKKNDIIKMIETAKVHQFDECHVCACETIQKIYKHLKSSEYIYGLSGSPWREDNADLLVEGILGKYIVNIPASYLIERGLLARPIIRFMTVPEYDGEIQNNYQSVYKKYVVENPVRNELVLKATKQIVDQGYQTLVLFNNLSHGRILYDMIRQELPCAILDGSDSAEEREAVKKQLTEGKIKCILASKIFEIGVDLPSLSGLVIACAGKSSIKSIQRIGRVIRKFPGKRFAAVVDFADNCKWLDKHSKIRYKVYKSEEGFDVKWNKKK